MTQMGAITCCRNCKPPKRNEGCHATCEEYQQQKKAREEYLDKVREAKKEQSAGFSEHMLTHTHSRGKIRKKGQP